METSHGVRGSASRAARGGSGIEWTPANVVTMVRICLIPLFVVLMLAPWGTALFTAEVAANVQPWCALVLFVLISMTDGIDGYLARSRNEITVFGKFMDPIADKVLVMSALIVLVQLGSMPSWIPIVILTRELLVSGLRMLVASAGVVVAASWIGKAKTATTMVAICLFIVKGTPALYPAQPWFSLAAWVAMIVAVVLTVVSMIDYFAKSWPLLMDAQGDSPTGASQADDLGTPAVVGSSELARHVVALARSRGVVLATAESCTGGLVSSALTSVPGSSACVAGGVVSYLASVKESVLSVPAETIERDGVVSSQTAEAMARGVCERLGAGLAVSTTGVAGPTGGTKETPVGTVWFGLSDGGTASSEVCHFDGSRSEVREQAVAHALSMLLNHLADV